MIRFLADKNGSKIPYVGPVFKHIGVFVALQLCYGTGLLLVYQSLIFAVALFHVFYFKNPFRQRAGMLIAALEVDVGVACGVFHL